MGIQGPTDDMVYLVTWPICLLSTVLFVAYEYGYEGGFGGLPSVFYRVSPTDSPIDSPTENETERFI